MYSLVVLAMLHTSSRMRRLFVHFVCDVGFRMLVVQCDARDVIVPYGR